MMQLGSNAYQGTTSIGEIVSLGNSQLVLGLIYVIQANDMRMIDELHDGYLAFDASVYGSLVDQ